MPATRPRPVMLVILYGWGWREEVADNASIFEHAGDIAYSAGNRHAAFGYWRKALSLTTDRTAKRRVQRKLYRTRRTR